MIVELHLYKKYIYIKIVISCLVVKLLKKEENGNIRVLKLRYSSLSILVAILEHLILSSGCCD